MQAPGNQGLAASLLDPYFLQTGLLEGTDTGVAGYILQNFFF